MSRAKTLLDQPDSCLNLLSAARAQQAVVLDIPIETLLEHPVLGYDSSIELHGAVGSGKTHLLYILVIEAILVGKAVIVFDTDLKWDNTRLLDLLQAKMTEDPVLVERDLDALHLLDSVIIYQPQSSKAFLEDVGEAYNFCLQELQNQSVRYLLVDSMSAFHWQYTVARETPVVEVYNALRQLAIQISASLVYSTWDLGFNYIALPHSTRLAVNKKQVLQFTQGLEQAFETKEARMEVLSRGISYLTSQTSRQRVAFRVQKDSCSFL